jgi:excisionase family DNA binding protein
MARTASPPVLIITRPTRPRAPFPVATDWDALPLVLTVEGAAAVIGINRSTVYRLLKSGEFPAKRVRGRLVVPKHLLRSWLEGEMEQT